MTDHAAEALFEIDRCRVGLPESSGGPREMEALAIAQVHATLALGEEQRTANLIAVLASGSGDDGETWHAVRMDVLARLGLTPTTPNQEQNR